VATWDVAVWGLFLNIQYYRNHLDIFIIDYDNKNNIIHIPAFDWTQTLTIKL